MKTQTLVRSLAWVAVAIWVLGAAPLAQAQGRSGGGGKTQNKASSQQGQQAEQRGDRAAGHDHQMQRIQLHAQERDRYKDGVGTADRIRRRAGELAKAAKGAGFNVTEARGQQDQLREHVGTMFQEHDRFMGSFGEDAQGKLQDRTRMLDQDRERINSHLQAMNRQLERDNPDQGRIRAEARELKKAMKAWQKHYRQLGDDVGVTAG